MDYITGILNSIKSLWAYVQAIPAAINSVVTWAEGEWNQLWSEVTQLYQYVAQQAEIDLNYALALFQSIQTWTSNLVTGIYQWVLTQISSLDNWFTGLINQALSYISYLENWAETQFSNLISWINTEIVQPIWSAIDGAINWIGTYGAFVVNLLTHPDLLASLLGKYILASWKDLGAQFAKPFFSWFYRNAISLAPDFASLFEDIISSLFD